MERKEVQKFEFGQRYEISLKHKSGWMVRKPWGDSVCYLLTSNRVAFFPVDVSEEIKSLNLSPREPFEIIRRRENNLIQWEVERIQKQERLALTAPVPEAFTPAVPVLAEKRILEPDGIRDSLLGQLIAAVDAVVIAEREAPRVLGRTIEFTAADIRALALAAFQNRRSA